MKKRDWFGRETFFRCAVAGAVVVGAFHGAQASTINFEQYGAGTAISTQYAGATFANALEETSATVSRSVYTPQSGAGFITNADTVTSVSFDTLQSAVSGWYASYFGMTLSAYGADNTLLSAVNYGSSGVNAAWSLSSIAGIQRITFAAPTGTVAVDDLSYGAAAATPEPGSLLLMGTGLFGAAAICVARASRVERT